MRNSCLTLRLEYRLVVDSNNISGKVTVSIMQIVSVEVVNTVFRSARQCITVLDSLVSTGIRAYVSVYVCVCLCVCTTISFNCTEWPTILLVAEELGTEQIVNCIKYSSSSR